MSRPMADTPKQRRPRRRFDDEFKEQAVRLVLEAARADFKTFIAGADPTKYRAQINAAEQWIEEINQILSDRALVVQN